MISFVVKKGIFSHDLSHTVVVFYLLLSAIISSISSVIHLFHLISS